MSDASLISTTFLTVLLQAHMELVLHVYHNINPVLSHKRAHSAAVLVHVYHDFMLASLGLAAISTTRNDLV